MSDSARTSEANWNESPLESRLSQNQVLQSIAPWTAKCLSRDTGFNFLRADTSLFSQLPLTPTTPTYYQTSPQSVNSYSSVQPDSPSSVDDYPDVASADEDIVQLKIRAKRLKSAERSAIRKSFTIDAILGLEDLAASLKNKGSSDGRLTSSNNQEEPHLVRHSMPQLNQQTCEASGMTSASASNSRSKRVRTIFSAEQLEKLEAEFARQQYMVGPERLVLAASLRLSESQVKVWFQNRRIKWRKQHLEARQMRFPNWQQDEHLAVHHHNFAQMFHSTEGLDDTLESLSD